MTGTSRTWYMVGNNPCQIRAWNDVVALKQVYRSTLYQHVVRNVIETYSIEKDQGRQSAAREKVAAKCIE
jgi:hypothetical protein